MKVAFLGPVGSFSHVATKSILNEKEHEFIPFSTIPQAILAIEEGEVEVSIIPIENSIEGSVNTSVDYLFHHARVKVVREIVLPISQQFLTLPETEGSSIEKIASHPQALAQSGAFLAKHFPHVEILAMNSTTQAAQWVKDHPQKNYAAIASKQASKEYGLKIVQENIQDLEINNTRFWVISKNERLFEMNPKQKMSIAITMGNNKAGILHQALSAFAWRSIDLVKIESRPLKTILGEYFFLVDLLIAKGEEQLIDNALQEIELLGGNIKVFGKYDVFQATEANV